MNIFKEIPGFAKQRAKPDFVAKNRGKRKSIEHTLFNSNDAGGANTTGFPFHRFMAEPGHLEDIQKSIFLSNGFHIPGDQSAEVESLMSDQWVILVMQ